MRPITLTVKGFTAFREESTLRFDDLGLFAIWGPTGSGKSSLLDAMTYALYGQVERVGIQVGQLISHGQLRLSSSLEFAVGDDRYRVTRSTSRTGSAKVLLERASGEDTWESDGEGSDKVRDVNKRVTRLLGLDYDGFTRSILLPQGKFAEFLVGDAKERRAILTELLGLELFGRMAKRAGEMAKEAKTRAIALSEVLDREYAGISPEAVKAADVAIEEATAGHTRLQEATDRIQDLSDRSREIARALERITAEAATARDLASTIAGGVARAAALARSLEAVDVELAFAVDRSHATTETAAEATRALKEVEAQFGSTADLATALGKAQALPSAQRTVDELVTEADDARKAEPALTKQLTRAEADMKRLAEEAATVTASVETARTAYQEAQQVDRVASLCSGLHPGDPCPVCATPLTEVPGAGEARAELERLKNEGTKLAADAKRAEDTARAAERERDRFAADLRGAQQRVQEVDARLAKARAAHQTATSDLLVVFAGALPDDPATALRERIDAIEVARLTEKDATAAAAQANAAVGAIEKGASEARTALAVEKARLAEAPVAALFARVLTDISPEGAPSAPAPITSSEDGEQVVHALTALAGALDEAGHARQGGAADLLRQAQEAVGDLLQPQPSFQDLERNLSAAVTAAVSSVAVARQRADTVRERLEGMRTMMEEVEVLGQRADRFGHLALQLRADRLIAFLQSEALQLLCDAASAHLGSLSDDRYRLICEEDEFKVVDTWNGEETRSVKTLSGGETFMASLSLALALSEQVPTLSVTQHAQLDSLFLDEGFGTLDSSSLQEVLEALSALGGDGRLVGVITHLSTLADELPNKVIIEKSPRGSKIAVT